MHNDECREWQVTGPPGSGKTSYLSNAISDAVRAHGSDAVIVTSFTRAAAAELVARGLPLRKDQVGTLHAHCYRALGRPPVAEDKITEWNAENPGLALSQTGNALFEEAHAKNGPADGAAAFAEYQRLRAIMRPRTLWSAEVQSFALHWEDWKRAGGYLDFTDMIETAYHNLAHAPGNPSILFADENQDFVPLELALVRKWGTRMEFFILCGDADQCAYQFKGASPRAFLDHPVPESHRRVLTQSYRVPRAVRDLAHGLISRIADRQKVTYEPRHDESGQEVQGEVRRIPASYKTPGPLFSDMEPYLAAGKSVLVLGSCSYMLDPFKRFLHEQGVPYHNPLRRSRGDWNPLNPQKGIPTADRILAYLRPDQTVWGEEQRVWTGRDLQLWSDLVERTGVFKRGMKSEIDAWPEQMPVGYEQLQRWLMPGVLGDILDVPLDWLVAHAKSSKTDAVGYPARIAARYGAAQLKERPQIILGTCHSYKGGEADCCYVYPDVSLQGYQQTGLPGGRDALIRLFYVATTRCRETLVLCADAGGHHLVI